MTSDVCEYCSDPLCGGECKPHPGSIISLVGLGGLFVILAFVILRTLAK